MRDQFLKEIEQNYNANAPKLIYADWLEEQGDSECEAWRWIVQQKITLTVNRRKTWAFFERMMNEMEYIWEYLQGCKNGVDGLYDGTIYCDYIGADAVINAWDDCVQAFLQAQGEIE